MKKEIKLDAYTPEEERANVITHVPGIVLGIAGWIYSMLAAGTFIEALGLSIFFITVIALYTSSSLYHWVKSKPRKLLFKKLDHIGIYLLIAGTFTPFTVVVLGDQPIGQNMSLAIWSIALVGTNFKIFFTGRFEFISLASYIGMGWLGYLMFGQLSEILGDQVVDLMLYGGLCYTGGVVFYVMRKLKYHHAIWHVFVLAGTVFHTMAILSIIYVNHA